MRSRPMTSMRSRRRPRAERYADGTPVHPAAAPGRTAARRGPRASRLVRNAAVHVLELYDPASGARCPRYHLGPRETAVSLLGRVRGHAAAAAGIRLADLAFPAHRLPAVGVRLLRGESARLLPVVPAAVGSHMDRAYLFRMGERVQ